MLKNQKLGTKFSLGFGSVILILMALGITAYWMFSTIKSDVETMDQHFLAAVRNGGNIERTSFETVVAEKNYIIYKKEDDYKLVLEKIAKIYNSLDEFDKLGTRFADAGISNQSKTIRDEMTLFKQKFEQSAIQIQAEKNLNTTMDQTGEKVETEITALLSSKKKEYFDEIQKMNFIKRISAAIQTLRENTQNSQEQQTERQLIAGDKETSALLGLLGELEKLSTSEEEKQSIAELHTAAQDYVIARQKLAVEQKSDAASSKLTEKAALVEESGRKLDKTLSAYLAVKTSTVNQSVKTVFSVEEIGQNLATIRLLEKKYSAHPDPQLWTMISDTMIQWTKKINEFRKSMTTDVENPAAQISIPSAEEYCTAVKNWKEGEQQLREVALPQLKQSANTIITIQKIQDDLWQKVKEDNTEIISLVGRSKMIIIFALLIGVTLGGAFSLLITKSIVGPMRIGVRFAEQVAEGDLTQQIDLKQKDEIGQLALALNSMTQKIREVMEQITRSATEVAAGSEELSASSQSLANAATEQAASLEETTTAIEELTSTIQQNAVNAKETNSIATETAKAVDEYSKTTIEAKQICENTVLMAQEGGKNVESMVESMKEISTSSKKIADIIKVIDDIADQTNLLALNAAIEAARAGEMGKGFAVVAVEVRKLAERSQQAAKEISNMITDSVQKVNEGAHLANLCGESLQKIVTGISQVSQTVQNVSKSSQEQVVKIRKTTELIQEISLSCAEQATGAEQISKAITQLDQVTQQNSSTSEEISTSSEELTAQAQRLQEMVNRFKTEENGQHKMNSHVSPIETVHSGSHADWIITNQSKNRKTLPFYESNEEFATKETAGKIN